MLIDKTFTITYYYFMPKALNAAWSEYTSKLNFRHEVVLVDHILRIPVQVGYTFHFDVYSILAL